jgi:ribosome-associated toxin RatA of RatAB toxin-antitoxin module
VRTVYQRAIIPEPATVVYQRLADFRIYPEVAPSVLRIETRELESDRLKRCRSTWEVKFRSGVLRWVEDDEFDPAAMTVTFHQTEGDLATLEGSWSISECPSGAELRFEAQFDLGLPGLEDFLEPVAQRALEDNIGELITRLFENAVVDESKEKSA